MSDSLNGKKPGSDIVVKAGLWYTVCNFLFRGVTFLVTPVFARLLTKAEIGSFDNLASWVGILTVVTAFDLQTSIIRSKLEFLDDLDSYISSILALTSVATGVFYGIFLLFPAQISGFMGIETKYVHLIFLYLFFTPAYQMLITKHRALYKYKFFVAITGITIISSALLSLTLVLLLENKFTGRVFGNYIPYIIVGLIFYIYLFVKGKKIKIAYWKYACKICLPLVPHLLSLFLLSSSDKIILTRLSGAEIEAIYAISYTTYHVLTVLFDSMNRAWAPWLLDSLHQQEHALVKKTSKVYIVVFLGIAFGVLLVVPELIYILGGEQYMAAVYCLPPLIFSCILQFIYTMYVNVEFYLKKTVGVAIATIIATLINIGLNFVLIPLDPEHGYIIAAITTMIGYTVLFISHFLVVKRLKMSHVYDTKFVLLVLALSAVVCGFGTLLYSVRIVRYIVIAVYGCALLFVAYKFKDKIIALLKPKKKQNP